MLTEERDKIGRIATGYSYILNRFNYLCKGSRLQIERRIPDDRSEDLHCIRKSLAAYSSGACMWDKHYAVVASQKLTNKLVRQVLLNKKVAVSNMIDLRAAALLHNGAR